MEITLETLDAKLTGMAGDIAEVKKQLQEMNGRQRADHDRVVRVEERLRLFSGLGIGWSVLLSSIAAWIGGKS